MLYLHEIFENPFAKKLLQRVEIPTYITDSLKYTIRPYQIEAFKRYIYTDTEDFDGKPDKPLHLLYNMATGSGKTLVMAGLILYLYERGHRNFLFFVNSNNIIRKTKDNFLNPQASKYLFSDKIVIEGKEVLVKEVENFDEADHQNINIKFTTIQQLHIDLNNTKENSVTYEDFKDKKIVLIADEAHHLSSGTKRGRLFGSWEDTVMKILESNFDNILLEFTATLDYESREIVEKYQDKVLYKYDLKEFRLDKYSKEINLFRSYYDEKERIIQALILSLYRQELATSHNINLKPVILFKAKRTIAQSQQNKANFHQLIEELDINHIQKIQRTATIDIVQKAFTFFSQKNISTTEIAKRIQAHFKEENCLSANNDKEAEKNQILLNTLEDENNPIRAIFAVQKLNEGWDVLNLFDIVRLYEGQNTGGTNKTVGKTTLAEAQLIGRGARYFPFALEEGQDKYKRKYDNDASNDLKVLEELYYHAKEDNRYIGELKRALIESGIYEDNLVTKELKLKETFKKTDFFLNGQVIFNKKIEKSYNNIKSFADLGVAKKNHSVTLSSGAGRKTKAFGKTEDSTKQAKIIQKDIALADIPNHITRYALTQNPFFYFNNLTRYFPNIGSLSNFIQSEDYLGSLEITFNATEERFTAISNFDYLMAIQKLLQAIEAEVKANLTEYEGSDYIYKPIRDIFKDKEIKVLKGSERADGQFEVVTEPNWYAYNANYGTSEEKEFVKMFARKFEQLEQKFKEIYLIRNERTIKIVDKLGRAFEPDFILFCKQKSGQEITYQVFIEPKGKHLKSHDKWKEEFLQKIREEKRIIEIHSDKYLITGVPFYNNENENEFKESLESTLNQ